MSIDSEILFPRIYSKKIIQKYFLNLHIDSHIDIKTKQSKTNLGYVPYGFGNGEQTMFCLIYGTKEF